MKDPESKKSLNETEEKAVSGGLGDDSSFLKGKQPVTGRVPLFNQGEPVPPYEPQKKEPCDGGATGSW
jgi:hypothetical protein